MYKHTHTFHQLPLLPPLLHLDADPGIVFDCGALLGRVGPPRPSSSVRRRVISILNTRIVVFIHAREGEDREDRPLFWLLPPLLPTPLMPPLTLGRFGCVD